MKHTRTFFRTFFLLTVCIVLACAGQAHAAQLQQVSNAPYLCAAVQAGDTANGTPVIAYSCSGAFNQQWNFVNGQLRGIGTANGQDMCLDVKGAGTTPGTLVDLYQCNGGLNQQWAVLPALTGPNKGATLIMAYGVQENELCLDTAGGPSSGGGTQLVVNTCNLASASQNWNVRGMEIELNTNAPYLCAADEASETANGTPVIAYSCSGAFNDQWNYSSGHIIGIGSANGNTKCLTMADTTTAGSLVTLSACNGSLKQYWWIVPLTGAAAGEWFGAITGAQGGLCLDSAGGPSSGGGTQLVVNHCNGSSSQNWNVH